QAWFAIRLPSSATALTRSSHGPCVSPVAYLSPWIYKKITTGKYLGGEIIVYLFCFFGGSDPEEL
ncbi:MAG: hypothetical protein M3R47_17760, partial [Chloroflexota bacterium]|nr:hypothetical protein [Chloroflexota bacterium]